MKIVCAGVCCSLVTRHEPQVESAAPALFTRAAAAAALVARGCAAAVSAPPLRTARAAAAPAVTQGKAGAAAAAAPPRGTGAGVSRAHDHKQRRQWHEQINPGSIVSITALFKVSAWPRLARCGGVGVGASGNQLRKCDQCFVRSMFRAISTSNARVMQQTLRTRQ